MYVLIRKYKKTSDKNIVIIYMKIYNLNNLSIEVAIFYYIITYGDKKKEIKKIVVQKSTHIQLDLFYCMVNSVTSFLD